MRLLKKSQPISLSEKITSTYKDFFEIAGVVTKEKEIANDDLEKFYNSISEKRISLVKEIRELEKLKAEALKPIHDIENEARIKLENVEKKEKEVLGNSEQLEKKTKEIHKLTELGIKRDLILKGKESKIDKLLENSLNKDDKLNKELKLLEISKEKFKQNTENKLKEIEDKEKDILDRERIVKTLTEENLKEKEEIQKDRLHLFSQQQQLKEAYNQAKLKNII